ncbi:hypothetical protein GDO86_002179 [Hymenochirus boettgeri]|uniref:Uncharacterized protein n=1 Tax=Hymenochirus boettgeri TaxID=247094 RepID=A0A8T2KGU6_9PIPI|nr:hypothetical protein GDO86_002179 [Hymenochirus boettgeri]
MSALVISKTLTVCVSRYFYLNGPSLNCKSFINMLRFASTISALSPLCTGLDMTVVCLHTSMQHFCQLKNSLHGLVLLGLNKQHGI